MGFHRFGEPHAVLKPECPVCECTNGTYIDHIPAEIIFYSLRNISRDFRMISPIQDSMHSFIGQLIGDISTTITEDASCHVELYVGTDIFSFKSSPCKFIPGSFLPMFI